MNEEMRKVNSNFEAMIAENNFSKIEEIYSDDARILPPGANMIGGLPLIQAFWEQAASALKIKSLKLSTIDVQVTAETAVEVGEAIMTTELPSSPNALKYLVVWKNGESGWRWQVDIWNAAAEPQPHSAS